MRHWLLISAPRSASSYFREVLADGSELASAILKHCDLDLGELRLLVPAGIALPPAVHYKESLKNIAPDLGAIQASSRRVLSKVLSEVDVQHASAIVIEDYVARPGDRALTRFRTGVVVRKHRIYHVLAGANSTPASVVERLKLVATWPIGILAKCRIDAPRGVAQMASAVLDSALSRGEFSCVAVAAFDNESFLVWTSRDEASLRIGLLDALDSEAQEEDDGPARS
ncbi:MAG: hypothetical protein L0Y64_12025 [Myxococcaceae bacterium]|nr:hypothetical protein [Myxococcaceae bacterium]